MSTPVLNVEQLAYSYFERSVLQNVSFQLEGGKYYALLGPNGAGKSTLFALLCQLLHPANGEIIFNGSNTRRYPRRALSQIGMVYQQSTLDLDLSVQQNLLYHASLHGISKRLAAQRVTEELGRFNMLDRQHDKIRSLNGGHRRRVEIARALLHKPSILLLDEATVGLDQATRDAINLHLRKLCYDEGITILSATHLVDEVQLEDELLIIVDGTIRLQQRCAAALSQLKVSNPHALYHHFHSQRQAV